MARPKSCLGTRLLSHWIRVNTCAEILLRTFVHWGLCLLRGCVSLTKMLGSYSEKAGDEGLRRKRGRCVPVLRGQTRLPGFLTLLFARASLCNTFLLLYYQSFYFQLRYCCGGVLSITKVSVQYLHIDSNTRHHKPRPHLSLPYYQPPRQCKQSFSNTKIHR